MKKIILSILLVVLSIFLIEAETINGVRINRVCIDNHEYVMTSNGIIQSFIKNNTGPVRLLLPKTCSEKDRFVEDKVKRLIR